MTKIDFEFTSIHRNRNLWPNPCIFEVPWSGNGKKSGNDSVDPVSLQSPEVVWKGQLINIPATVVSQSGDNVVISAALNALNQTAGYYDEAEFVSPSGLAVPVSAYMFLAQSGASDYASISAAGSSVQAGNSVTLRVTSVPNTLFVPSGTKLIGAYVGYYLFNETQNQYVLITGYVNGRVIANIPTGWLSTDAYSIRKELPALQNFAIGSGNTVNTLNLSASGISITPGDYVRALSTGETSRITSYNSTTGFVTLDPALSAVLPTGALVEIFTQSYDNYNALSYSGTTVGQHEQVAWDAKVVSAVIPNKLMQNGGYPSDYPYLYIEFMDTNHPNQNILFSNNNISKSLFRVTMPIGQFNILEKFTKYTGDLSHKTVRFRPTSNFRVAWRLPSGEEIKFVEQDSMSPNKPSNDLQVSVHFNLSRN
jgi:hypothetical protein